MDRRGLLALVVLLGLALQLLAHAAPTSPHLRETLPEDAPAFVANRALAAAPGESIAAPLRRALTDPASAWEPAGAIAAQRRFRPVAAALFVVERAAGGAHATQLVGWVSLLLHLGLVVLVHGIVRRLRGPPAAQLMAAALVAATPLALAAAAWPARQPAVLAAVLGAAGLTLTLRSARPLHFAGGLLLAAAVLSHEAALGLVAAAVVLRGAFESDVPLGRRAVSAALVAAPAAVALVWRATVLAPLAGPASTSGPDVFDGVVGAILTWLAPLLPVRLHVADGPWEAHGAVRLVAAAALAWMLVALWRRRRDPWGAALLATLLATLPALAAGAYGQAPFSATAAYVTLPIAAGGIALGLATAVRRGGALRTAALSSGVLLLLASTAATATRVSSYRARDAFVARAERDAPSSSVVLAWRLGDAVVRAENAPPTDRGAAVSAASALARTLTDRLLDGDGELTEEGQALAGDGVAATTLATVLARYIRSVADAEAEGGEGAPTPLAVERAGRAATSLLPQWAAGWAAFAESQLRMGGLAGALDAADQAGELRPDDIDLLVLEGRIALTVGHIPLALVRLGEALTLGRQRQWGTPEQRRELTLMRAEALVADAATSGRLNEFDTAAELLEALRATGDEGLDLRQATYDLYLVWGDELASRDRTALARIAYQRAVALSGPNSWAAEHLAWLDARLAREWREAGAALERSQAGSGNPLNALRDIAIVLCRRGEWREADEVFARIEQGQGGMNAALRYSRAIHRHAARPDELDVAEAELRAVMAELPGFAEARFNLAGVLVQMGRLEEAREEYLRAARDGPEFEWCSEALQVAHRLAEILLLERQ